MFAVADGMGARGGASSPRASGPGRSASSSPRAPTRNAWRRRLRLANRRVAERATEGRIGARFRHGLDRHRRARRPRQPWFSRTSATRAPTSWRGGVLTRPLRRSLAGRRVVKAGRACAGEAEHHPQRSVITRALGTDWQIEVDTWTTPARSGDVFPALHRRPRAASSTTPRIRRRRCASTKPTPRSTLWWRPPTRRGGEDNITAVALRLEPDEGARTEPVGAGEAGDGPRPGRG